MLCEESEPLQDTVRTLKHPSEKQGLGVVEASLVIIPSDLPGNVCFLTLHH